MNAEELVKLLRSKYRTEDNGFNPRVILEQVPDGTGFVQKRWIDVAVFEMWSTKGLRRSAFEIKVTRNDFLNELSHPEKHAWCLECFHFFWFVAPKDVIQVEELPAGAGWMYPKGQRLCVARHPVLNPSPKLDDFLLAAFMRAAHKEIETASKRCERDVLDSSSEHIAAKWYMEATLQFLQAHHDIPSHPESAAEILKALNEATADQQFKQDRDRLLDMTGKFQREIAGLLSLFAVIANKSLLARDELGRFVVSAYGGNDSEGLESLKELAKSARATDYERRYAELIEILLNWEKLNV